MANNQALKDEEGKLLYSIDNHCPRWCGLTMKERTFVIELFAVRARHPCGHIHSEKQIDWLRAIEKRVSSKVPSELPVQ